MELSDHSCADKEQAFFYCVDPGHVCQQTPVSCLVNCKGDAQRCLVITGQDPRIRKALINDLSIKLINSGSLGRIISTCQTVVRLLTDVALITGSIARSAKRRYLIYSEADFEVFTARRSYASAVLWES